MPNLKKKKKHVFTQFGEKKIFFRHQYEFILSTLPADHGHYDDKKHVLIFKLTLSKSVSEIDFFFSLAQTDRVCVSLSKMFVIYFEK